MVLIGKIKPANVIADYYEERRERHLILEKNRQNMEKILKVRKEIEKRRKEYIFQPVENEKEFNKEDDSKASEPKTLEFAEQDESDSLIILFDKMRQTTKKIDKCMNHYIYDEDSEEEEDEDNFSMWLKSITQCLSGKICDNPIREATSESDDEDEDADEDVRCMNIVKSVFDEDTATKLVKNYLKFSKVRERKNYEVKHVLIMIDFQNVLP